MHVGAVATSLKKKKGAVATCIQSPPHPERDPFEEYVPHRLHLSPPVTLSTSITTHPLFFMTPSSSAHTSWPAYVPAVHPLLRSLRRPFQRTHSSILFLQSPSLAPHGSILSSQISSSAPAMRHCPPSSRCATVLVEGSFYLILDNQLNDVGKGLPISHTDVSRAAACVRAQPQLPWLMAFRASPRIFSSITARLRSSEPQAPPPWYLLPLLLLRRGAFCRAP